MPPAKKNTRAVPQQRATTRRRTVKFQPAPLSPSPGLVVLAVTGESPAILTETIWALAHEKTPALPSKVIVLTTTIGEKRLRDELLTAQPTLDGRTTWQALRDELLPPGNHDALALEVRVITGPVGDDGCPTPLDDLRSPDDNSAAADFILDQVRSITANPDTRLLASIAGGRKTMGALLYAAMTLVGRETDRLTHVLVSAPFDQRLTPPFYFKPTKPVIHVQQDRAGRKTRHSSAQAVIELADVPFVPLRNAFEELKRPAGSFARLVARYRRELQERAEPPTITLDGANHSLRIDGREVAMENEVQIAILRLLLRQRDDLAAIRPSFKECVELVKASISGKFEHHNLTKSAAELARKLCPARPENPPWLSGLDHHAITRTLSELRRRAQGIWTIPQRTVVLPKVRFNG